MSILELRNVEKIYGEKDNQVKALRNINLKVEEGEFVAIVGTSGSGKSTCLNLIGVYRRLHFLMYHLYGRKFEGSRRTFADIG